MIHKCTGVCTYICLVPAVKLRHMIGSCSILTGFGLQWQNFCRSVVVQLLLSTTKQFRSPRKTTCENMQAYATCKFTVNLTFIVLHVFPPVFPFVEQLPMFRKQSHAESSLQPPRSYCPGIPYGNFTEHPINLKPSVMFKHAWVAWV